MIDGTEKERKKEKEREKDNMYIYIYLTLPVTLVMSLDSTNHIKLTISNLRPVTSFYIIDSPFTMYILGFRQSYDKLVDTVGETIYIYRERERDSEKE